ncbi:hypothetical protein CCUS01_04026 [Colletotrichum cuscutae]|uniref:Uncharacterized protein n=1 Tax=Colletotrichum cuscutae TaxID=1209917 RepID=A0AAI9VFZ7_9PEZI|nr:hypothetical protein CCUS01_04026 [Colletotrichum cuscutae]
MSGPQENPVDFLQQLADVGLLTPIVEQSVEVFQFSCFEAAIPDLKIGVGELLPSQPKRLPIPILYKPHSTPTLLWKALTETLAPFFSNATNLSDEEQSMFLATPTQTGIPGGDLAPAEAVNFQVFQKADALQILNCPTFSLDQGSYFTELNKFMRNLVSDDNSFHIDVARQSLLKVTEAKNAAWNNALARYEARIDDEFKTPIFQDFIEDDEDYKKTWQQELDAQRRYVSLQGGDMEAISQQISILKLADNRIDFKSL